jgi:hypothetical protein
VISAAEIKRLKLDTESLKARFDRPLEQMTPAERTMVLRWSNRAQSGRDFNLQHYKTYLALERAWDANFYQSTQTLVGFLHDLTKLEGLADVESLAQKWDMTHLLTDLVDEKTGQPTGRKTVSVPTMYSVIVALGRAYTLTRVSRLVNERLSTPLMKYEPAVSTDANRAFCEVTTQGIGVINREFGHAEDFKQGVQGAGKYGQQLMLAREDWCSTTDHYEGTTRGKEGLRYVFPHPFRSYYDVSHPLRTFNSDTGCRYLGYWDQVPFGVIRNHRDLWNRDRIKRSTRSLDSAYTLFLNTYGGCRISTPTLASPSVAGPLDPVAATENLYYGRSEDEQPVWVTEHFEKFNPRTEFEDPSMPDTDLWFRIRMASDDTPIFVSCLPDRPGVVWLWEPDDQRVLQEGMLLQLIPFQDQLTNLFTQANLSARQNLANLTLINSDVISETDVNRLIRNAGEVNLRKLNIVPVSFRHLEKLNINAGQGVAFPVQFPVKNVGELMAIAGQLLSLLERVTGMSAQEVGSYASHEQSAEEVRQIHTATSQRYEFIASSIDSAFEAWKAQLYTYWIAYGRIDVVAKLDPAYEDTMQKLGFQAHPDGTFSVPPSRVRVNGFVAQRDGPNRVPWAQLGSQMIQLLTTLAPMLQGQPAQLIKLLNDGFEAMGLPRSFRIQGPEQANPTTMDVVQGELSKYSEAIKPAMSAAAQAEIAKFAEAIRPFLVPAQGAD